jgi:hypothetical protein
MKYGILLIIGSLMVTGCNSSGDPGDVETAKKASQSVPKSPEELPSNMPPEARKAAEGAIGQRKAQESMMNQRMDAMKEAQQKYAPK